MSDLAIYISGGTATVLMGVIVWTAKLTWWASRLEKSVRDESKRDIARLEAAAVSRGDTYRNEFGETCAAIRQKLHDVEVFTRDHFVTKDNFESAVRRIEHSFDKMSDRLETKLDQAVQRLNYKPD